MRAAKAAQLKPRHEDHRSGYAPYGVGPRRSLGFRWMELQLMINVLLVARHFTLGVHPKAFKHQHRLSPFPSMKPSKKLKFRIAERVR